MLNHLIVPQGREGGFQVLLISKKHKMPKVEEDFWELVSIMQKVPPRFLLWLTTLAFSVSGVGLELLF